MPPQHHWIYYTSLLVIDRARSWISYFLLRQVLQCSILTLAATYTM